MYSTVCKCMFILHYNTFVEDLEMLFQLTDFTGFCFYFCVCSVFYLDTFKTK